MQIDYALILSAGLGTRMGAIGKKIPKVLWPLYFKTLLELQIRYCQERGVKKIYINTHFLHDEIVKFLENSKLQGLVTILYEDPLLDSGGAIHNLANRAEINYNGNLLLVNGDQFLFFNDDYWLTVAPFYLV
jgi:NDP-sugar pyrophosphorylase family protein